MRQLIREAKKANKFINHIFIVIILSLFYVLIIGIGRILHLILSKKRHDEGTYWVRPNKKKLELESAY